MDQVGERTLHIKCDRKRWYNDARWVDNSKPPEEAPLWSISTTYQSSSSSSDEDYVDKLEKEAKANENITASGSGTADNNERAEEIPVSSADENDENN